MLTSIATRYTTLSRPFAFDRRAIVVLAGGGSLPLELDRQLSAVHRRHALRAAHDGRSFRPAGFPGQRRPPG